MHPQVDKQVLESQECQKAGHDRYTKARVFAVGDCGYARNFSSGPVWIEGTIIHSQGPLSYVAPIECGGNLTVL